MKLLVATAVNEPETLAHCLARSPDIVSHALALKTYEGFKTAGAAYNAAIAGAGGATHIIFAHQDVYLPAGTLQRLEEQLTTLDVRDPTWAIAGVIGGDAQQRLIGETWCSGHQRLLGSFENMPAQVETLDEMLLIYRVSSGLCFDEALPSFHLYGADIVLAARKAGRTTYVIDLPVVHHSRPVVSLSGAYLKAYRYIQRKWRAELPVFNLVCPLERGLWRYWLTEYRLRRKWRGVKGRPDAQGDDRVAEIAAIARANPRSYGNLIFYPCMPYAHKYANAVTDDGYLGALKRFLPNEGLLNAMFRGGKSLATKDIEGIITLLVDAEMKMFAGLPTPVIFLQNVVVDLLLGLKFKQVFRIFADHVRRHYGAEPGFITMNLPLLLETLAEQGVDNPIVCANINKIGFRMCGGLEAYNEALVAQPCRAIAMSVFASGAIAADEALDWVAQQPRVDAVVFGASSRANIRNTVALMTAADVRHRAAFQQEMAA